MLRETAKRIAEFNCALLYAVLLPIIRKRPYRIVLYYHDIKPGDVRSFEKQMAYLAHNCTVVKASAIAICPPQSKNVIVSITFDDAFVCVKEYAVPVLKKYRLPATIFAPTGNLGRKPDWPMAETCSFNEELILNEQELRELDEDGIEILSHSVLHSVLTEMTSGIIRDEMSSSKQALESILGHEVLGISYPHGEHNPEICEIASQAGYRYGFTIEPVMVDCSRSSMQIGRFHVEPYEGLLTFRLKLSGAYQVTKHLRALKRFLRKALH